MVTEKNTDMVTEINMGMDMGIAKMKNKSVAASRMSLADNR